MTDVRKDRSQGFDVTGNVGDTGESDAAAGAGTDGLVAKRKVKALIAWALAMRERELADYNGCRRRRGDDHGTGTYISYGISVGVAWAGVIHGASGWCQVTTRGYDIIPISTSRCM